MRKKLGLIDRIIYWINLVVAFLLVVSFVIPFIPPKSFPAISLLSLIVFPLLIANFLFVLYWLFRMKMKIVISLIVLVIAHFHFGSFFQFSSNNKHISTEKSLKVLSYNVHLFNAYEKNNSPKKVSETLANIVSAQQPDIICIQEYFKENEADFSTYPHQYVYFKGNGKIGQAVFSKYPILNKGFFDFKNSSNSALFVDILKEKDTLRVYNIHLQSLSIKPSISSLHEEDKQKFILRTSSSFKKQQQQAELILDHKKTSTYPVLLCGDFNNTPFSYVYHKLSANLNDAFVEKGNGLGTTYLFDSFPMRIDYILVSEDLNVVTFENIKTTFSDHYPVSATVVW